MKDIDFDELDRAVNSLISPSTTPAVPVAQPAESTALPVQVTTGGSSESPTLQSPAERRSGGRFMDVVHPSSDMRPTTPSPSETVSPSVPQPTLNVPVTPRPTLDTPPTLPDPITTQETASQMAPDPVVNAATDAPTAPLETPFLSDTKVEKRPLGAFSTDTPPEPPVSAPLGATPPEEPSTAPVPSDGPKPGDRPIGTDTPLPAELQSDVLSIESNEDTDAEKTETPVTEAPIAAPVVEPVGPTSITQQYSEQPSTGDKPMANVFDTEAYKKPQPKQKKKKTGWFVVLWIFLLLVVGAGVGAAVYFLVLPHIG